MKKFIILLIITTLFFSCLGDQNGNNGPNGSNGQKDDKNKDPYADFEITQIVHSPNAKRLMNYLSDQYGIKIIAGQQDAAWTTNFGIDMTYRVFEDTGKYPAIKGFDFLDLPFSWGDYGYEQLDEAIDWWNGKNRNDGGPLVKLLPDKPDIHGIITFCWHWRTGEHNEFYTNRTDFRIPWDEENEKLDTLSDDFKNTIISDLDKIAMRLNELKDLDIPVLWRPLHEAAGNWRLYNNTGNAGAWFWWGASGPEPYIALWEFMYWYFTTVKELNNLIWVWNGQNSEWYPNPITVDIVGYDVYAPAKDYGSQKNRFLQTKQMVPNQDKIVAMTENGQIPDPQKCFDDEAMWSWFCTWNDHVGPPGETNIENFWTGEFNNTLVHRQYVYNHELVITLDKLPDLTKYRLD